MKHIGTISGFVAATLALSIVGVTEGAAQFYKGKKLDIYTAGGGKGSYNRHLRVLEKYLVKHIPGNPKIAINPMPGAGGVKCANYLYNAAAKDGTAMGTLLKSIAMNEIIERRGVKYKTKGFGWVVSSGPIDSVLSLWAATSPAKTMKEVFQNQVILGSTGKGSPTFIEPTIMNALIGTKFKIITGYKGLGKVHLAVERGEVQGRFASWESLKCCKKAWLSQKKVHIILQSGLVRNVDLPNVPTVWEYAKNEKDKKFLKFMATASTLGRIYMTPPGHPKAALKDLRKGFWAALHDKEYLAEADKRGLQIKPMRPGKSRELALSMLNANQDIVKVAKKYLSRKKKKK